MMSHCIGLKIDLVVSKYKSHLSSVLLAEYPRLVHLDADYGEHLGVCVSPLALGTDTRLWNM